MSKLPDPSVDYFDKIPAIRILSDRGIQQAVKQGYLEIDPPINFSNPGKRLQPCTIDLKLEEIESNFKPGTRKGELYEYDTKVLFNAIRDYPTGYHEPLSKIEKNMIVVWK